MKNLLMITLLFIASTMNANNITGKWNGVLKVQGMQLSIIFNIDEKDGKFTTTMDSPDQGATDIPTDATTYTDGELTITLAAMRIKYEGKWNEETSSIEGTFHQGPMSMPLNLSREAVEKEVIVRPQDPTDFPYNQEEVTFVNPAGNHKLAGTLTTPTDGQFDKVLVLITGSGPQNRNEELLGHRPFLVLSDYCTRNGLAILRYDDRGVGESEGDFQSATTADFATDVSAAVDYLKSRKDMMGKKIGLMGHSEGGMIAPMVASTRKDIDMIVLLAGPGINIVDLMMLQITKMEEAEGTPADIVEANSKIIKEAFDYLSENVNLEKEALSQGLKAIFDKGFDNSTKAAQKEMGTKEAFFEEHSRMLLSDWFRFFLDYDPAEYLSKVTCPVLAINGEFDLQVTPKENLAGIKTALENAGNQKVTIKEFAGLNHLFQQTETGAGSEYGILDETFNEEMMEFVTNWIIEQ